LVWLVKTQKHNFLIFKFPNFQITNYQLPIILFLLSATISIFISPNLRSALGIYKAYFIEPILFLIVFINVINKEKLKRAFVLLCFCAFVLSAFAIYQKFTGAFIPTTHWAAESTRRTTSVFPYPNALALYLAPIITLLIGLVPLLFKNLDLKNYLKIKNYKIKNLLVTSYWLLVIITSLLAIYFTKSKGALIAIFTCLIFYAIFHKPYRKYFITIIGISFISIFLYFSISNTSINLQGSPTVEGGGSLDTRLEMWSETWAMLKTQPIFGAGLAGYQTLVAPFHQKDYIEIYLYPHNIILNFWSELGFLGLIAFIWIIIIFYINGFKNNQSEISELLITGYSLRVTIMAAMTTLLIHGLVDVPYFKNDLSILFWLIIGSIIILNKKSSATNY